MFPHKLANVLHMHVVVLVLLELQSRSIQHLISPGPSADVLLNLLVIMRQSWHLSSLPREVTDVHTGLDWHEKGKPVDDERPLVDVAPHGRVTGLNHFDY